MRAQALVATIGLYDQYIVTPEDAAALFAISVRSKRVTSYPLTLDTDQTTLLCSKIEYTDVEMQPEPEPAPVPARLEPF